LTKREQNQSRFKDFKGGKLNMVSLFERITGESREERKSRKRVEKVQRKTIKRIEDVEEFKERKRLAVGVGKRRAAESLKPRPSGVGRLAALGKGFGTAVLGEGEVDLAGNFARAQSFMIEGPPRAPVPVTKRRAKPKKKKAKKKKKSKGKK
jgi:hypothetical protein